MVTLYVFSSRSLAPVRTRQKMRTGRRVVYVTGLARAGGGAAAAAAAGEGPSSLPPIVARHSARFGRRCSQWFRVPCCVLPIFIQE